MNSNRIFLFLRLTTASLFIVLLLVNQSAIAATILQNRPAALNPASPSSKALKWADRTLKKMSVEEKVGQLVSIGINARFLNQDSEQFQDLKRHITENKVGGIILFGSPVYEAVHLTNRMQSFAKLPLLISADFEAGIGMRFDDTINFPWNMALGATGDAQLARRQGEITAREARALGVHQVFAPVVDVNNNAANPVINVRSYGENPQDVARYANAFIEGLQANGAIATAKHFPGHGDTAVDSHRGLPIIDLPRSRFDSLELMPFRSAINNGVGSVMVAHIALPQIDPTEVKPLEASLRPAYVEEGGEIKVEKATMPATLSPVVSTDILRKQLNFRGLIVTDAMDMSGLTLYFNQDDAAVRAVLAGADQILKPADVDASVRGLREAVKSGRISEGRLNDSVRRILAVKYDLGLTDNRFVAVEDIDKVVAGKPARDLAEEIAAKAVTLVKNEADLLPLRNLSPETKITILALTNGFEGMSAANSFANVLRNAGLKPTVIVMNDNRRLSEGEVRLPRQKLQEADIVIAAMLGRVRTGAKDSIGVSASGLMELKNLIKADKKVVGISFGNPYLLQQIPEMKTYLVAYGDMPSLQRAAARAVLGEQDITGKLPISLPGLFPIGTGIQLKAQTRTVAAGNGK